MHDLISNLSREDIKQAINRKLSTNVKKQIRTFVNTQEVRKAVLSLAQMPEQ